MNKVILITGTSSGFGRDAAQTLMAEGHRVFASMRDVDGRNRAAATDLGVAGVEIVELDVSCMMSVDRAVTAVIAKAGRIDVLINNAGVAAAGVTEAFAVEQAQALFDVNVFGVLRTIRAVLPYMRDRRGGLVITIGSILGRVTLPFFGLYGASQFALEALNDAFRNELAEFGVDVVLVQPSAYPTQLLDAIKHPVDDARVRHYRKTGRLAHRLLERAPERLFEGQDAPDCHDVALAIAGLVGLPAGERPQRVVVGEAFGTDAINAQCALIQQQLADRLAPAVCTTAILTGSLAA